MGVRTVASAPPGNLLKMFSGPSIFCLTSCLIETTPFSVLLPVLPWQLTLVTVLIKQDGCMSLPNEMTLIYRCAVKVNSRGPGISLSCFAEEEIHLVKI